MLIFYFRLKESGCPFRLVTNETTCTTASLLKKLLFHGFNVCLSDIFAPIPAVKSILKKGNYQPYLLVHNDVRLIPIFQKQGVYQR